MEAAPKAEAEAKLDEPKSEEPTIGDQNARESKPEEVKSEEPKSEEPKSEELSDEGRSTEPEPKAEPSIKEDPDAPEFVSAHSLGRRPRVKPEPQEPAIVDLSLPEATDDMFEDVDAEETVDLTYEGIAHVNGIRYFVCEGFKIRQIPEAIIFKRSLYDLYQCIEAKSIILDPEYQRDVVWDEVRSANLITSILMGYFIPPIIFNVKKSTVKVEGRDEIKFTRICVDGKQRLTSMWKFIKGQIGFLDNSQPQRKWYFCHQTVNGRLENSTRNILPDAVKEFFKKQFFCCYEYPELDYETEETMFQLVQRGIALTPAEKMRAMSTEWATYTKQFEDDYALVMNLSRQSRASAFRLTLTVFSMVIEIATGRRKKKIPNSDVAAPVLQASPQALTRLLEDKKPIDADLKQKFKVIFDRFEDLVKKSSTRHSTRRWTLNPNSAFDPAPEFLRDANTHLVRSFSPIELIVCTILIHIHGDHRSDEELLGDVRMLRQFLRNNHKDLRVNTQCWQTSWLFITTEMDKRRGIIREPRQPGDSSAAQKLKRSRDVDGDDDSSDLSSISSSDDDADEVIFEGLMSPRPRRKAVPKKVASKAKGKAKMPSKGSKPNGVTKSSSSKGKTKVSSKPGGTSKGKSTSAPAKKVRRT